MHIIKNPFPIENSFLSQHSSFRGYHSEAPQLGDVQRDKQKTFRLLSVIRQSYWACWLFFVVTFKQTFLIVCYLVQAR